MGRKTPFIMLFVPKIPWFQDLLLQEAQAMENRSFSSYLLELVWDDLKMKRKLSGEEQGVWKECIESQKKSRGVKPTAHQKFCLYLPKGLDFVKEKIKSVTDNQSKYVWNLFLEDQTAKLTVDQSTEWKIYSTTQQRGQRKG